MGLSIVTIAAYCIRARKSLLGVPLPSLLIVFCFLLADARSPDVLAGFPVSLFSEYTMLALLLVACACFRRDRRLFWLSVLFLAILHVEQAVLHGFLSARVASHRWEMREYLLSIACVLYAGELFSNARNAGTTGRAATALAWSVFACLTAMGGWLSVEVTGSLVEGARRDRFVRQVAAGAEPIRRADFDVHYDGSRLAYAKEDCSASDTEARFLLHLFPQAPDDLPAHRKPYGFDNLDFQWGEADGGDDVRYGGMCVAVVRLPDYPIVRIRTGQWIPDERRNLWRVEFEVGPKGAESQP